MGLGDFLGDVAGFTPIGMAVKGIGAIGSATQNHYQATPQQLADEEARKARFAQAIQQNQANSDQSRGLQTGYIDQLQAAANGQGPSVARQLLNQSQDQNLAQANAMAASARGDVNPAMLQRQAMMGMANNNQAISQQAGVMGAQEQLGARQQLGTAIDQTRGQDMANQQFYENTDLAAKKANLDSANAAQNINSGVAQNNATGDRQMIGGVMSGIGSAAGMAAMSDEKLKSGVKDGSDSMYKFLDAIKAHTYKYKEPGMDGQGQQHSVMAQELEKTPVGKGMVQETSRGKMVDYGKGFGAILAAQAALHERLKGLEKGSK